MLKIKNKQTNNQKQTNKTKKNKTKKNNKNTIPNHTMNLSYASEHSMSFEIT